MSSLTSLLPRTLEGDEDVMTAAAALPKCGLVREALGREPEQPHWYVHRPAWLLCSAQKSCLLR